LAEGSLDEIAKLPADLGRLAFSLSGQRFAYGGAAPGAADHDAGALAPVIDGACPVALHEMVHSEIVEISADIEVVGPERVLLDCKCALIECLGLGIAALRAIDSGEVAEVGAEQRVVGYLFRDRQCALEMRLGLGVAGLRDVDRCEIVETSGDIG